MSRFPDPRDSEARTTQSTPRLPQTRSAERPERPPQEPRLERGRPSERNPNLRRDRQNVRIKTRTYSLSAAERATLHDLGRFRTIAKEDLETYAYNGHATALRQDLGHLKAQGLIREHRVLAKPGQAPIRVLVLTKEGRCVAQADNPHGKQVFYAGLKKPKEVLHDAAIYRMYQAESQRIEAQGGRVRRVVLDYELKEKVYAPLARIDRKSHDKYAQKQADVARENGLAVVDGKIPLPDLRIEYDRPDGEQTKVDLELATEHYHARHLQEKAQAGFTLYAPQEAAGRLRGAWDPHNLMGPILSF